MSFDSLLERLRGLAYTWVDTEHPAELIARRLEIVREASGGLVQVLRGVDPLAVRTFENRLFISSRLVVAIASSGAGHPEGRSLARRVHLVRMAAVDLAAQATRIAIGVVFALRYRAVRPPPEARIVCGFGPPALMVAGQVRTAFPDAALALVLFPNADHGSQRAMATAPDMPRCFLPAGYSLLGLARCIGGFLTEVPRLLAFAATRKWGGYLAAVHCLTALELAAERRRCQLLAEARPRAIYAADDADYLAAYRATLLRRRQVAVVGMMHGIGVYGPNVGYSAYCVWGRYFEDLYRRNLWHGRESLRVTGTPLASLSPPPEGSGTAVAILLQPECSRNSRADLTKMIGEVCRWAASQPRPLTVICALHPRAGRVEADQVQACLRAMPARCEVVTGIRGLAPHLPALVAAVTNFSTAGLDLIQSGCPVYFRCGGTRALVPVAEYVPECHCREPGELNRGLTGIALDPRKRLAFLAEEQKAVQEMYSPFDPVALQNEASRPLATV